MLTALILVIADLAIGAAAWKMAKSNTTTNASLLVLLTKHSERLESHETRIVALEKAA